MATAKDIMRKNPVHCLTTSSLQEVANLMVKYDCGEIPVMDPASEVIAGVITDRDITCRSVAEGLNPLDMNVAEAMTVPAITVHPDTALDRCIHLMESNRIRRIPVVDNDDKICGMISLEDIASNDEKFAAEIMREISKSKSISLQ